jgi:hypothetical protein
MTRACAAALLILTAACGHNIGDSCTVSTDCAQDGSRVCDIFSPGGYCTIQGCDFGTCPSDSICARFYPALENAVDCNSGPMACAEDEVCTIGQKCAPTSIETRFCMKTCDSDGDCRDDYECRDMALMIKHGGEPVPDPVTGKMPTTKFCASRRTCAGNEDCAADEVCDIGQHVCRPR